MGRVVGTQPDGLRVPCPRGGGGSARSLQRRGAATPSSPPPSPKEALPTLRLVGEVHKSLHATCSHRRTAPNSGQESAVSPGREREREGGGQGGGGAERWPRPGLPCPGLHFPSFPSSFRPGLPQQRVNFRRQVCAHGGGRTGVCRIRRKPRRGFFSPPGASIWGCGNHFFFVFNGAFPNQGTAAPIIPS